MIDLDHRLLYDARRLITGENVHRMKELIFAYEQAVSLHNAGWAVHTISVYDPTTEIELRRSVLQHRIAEFESRLVDAEKHFDDIRGLFYSGHCGPRKHPRKVRSSHSIR
jgi:hypothetical protein